MRRLYDKVAVGQPETGSFAVLLDGRPVLTPARRPLHVPTAALAREVAAEWQAQGEKIFIDRMPLMRLAATALDQAAPDPAAYAERIAAYAETDLVCYRAQEPAGLVARQATAWQPLVDWAERTFAAPMTVTAGVTPVAQPDATLAALQAAVRAHNPFELAALGVALMASGSLIIALSLSHGRLDATAAFEASQIDEAWQAEQWGRDAEAETRRRNLRDDLTTAEAFLALYRAG